MHCYLWSRHRCVRRQHNGFRILVFLLWIQYLFVCLFGCFYTYKGVNICSMAYDISFIINFKNNNKTKNNKTKIKNIYIYISFIGRPGSGGRNGDNGARGPQGMHI